MFPYNRLHELFNYVRSHDHTKVQQLSTQLNISDRTIRSDIQTINEILEPYQMSIKLKRKYGYYLEINNHNLYQQFIQQLDNQVDSLLDSFENRIKYILKILLYNDDYISLDDLANYVYLSKNSIQNYIKQIKKIIVEYNLEYITKTNSGVKIIGNEADKRRCLINCVLSHNFDDYVVGFTKEERTIFNDINLDYIKNKIVEKLDLQHINTTDFSLKNLIIHFALMISRINRDAYIHTNNKITIPNHTLGFINSICKDFEDYFDITISNGEKQYLYLHLLANSDYEHQTMDHRTINEKVKQLLQTIYLDYNFDLRNDEILFNDLLHHFQSILSNKSYAISKRNPLLNTIKANFPLAYDITFTSTTKIFDTPPYTLNEDEVGYVSLHIGAAIERCFSGSIPKKSVILVCGSGQATTRMLEARLNVYFNDKILIVRKAFYKEFTNYTPRELKNVDFVISTIPIQSPYIPAITVDFSLTNNDIEAISRFLSKITIDKTKQINHFFDEKLFIHLPSVENKEVLIKKLCHHLQEQNVVSCHFFNSVMERESLAKTNMSDYFALPHPMEVCAHETKVAVAIVDTPVTWHQQDQVQIIFLLAIKPGDQQDIEHLYDIFIEIVNNNKLQQALIRTQSYQQFISTLNSYITE